LGLKTPTAAAVTLLLAGACGDLGGADAASDSPEAGTIDADSGTSPREGGTPDAGGAFPDAGPPPMGGGDEAMAIPATNSSEPSAGLGETDDGADRSAGSCFDGLDNDSSGSVDCNDVGCAGSAACCVGDGECCSELGAGSPLPDGLGFTGCDGMFVDTCVPDVTGFGDPLPWVRGGLLFPGGDTTYDSGLVVGDAVDLTAMRVRVSARFVAAEGCGASCLEGSAIGFTGPQAFDDQTHVRPIVALSLSGSRNEVSLEVGDAIVRRWSLSGEAETWTLVLRPSGEAEVRREGSTEAVADVSYRPVAGAQMVLYGRNRNRTSGAVGARIGDVSIETSLCDIPSAWPDRGELEVWDAGTTDPVDLGRARGTSLHHADGGADALAFELDGEIHFARDTGMGAFELTHALDAPAFLGDRSFDGGAVRDPELYRTASGEWRLYYTAEAEDGSLSIGMATSPDPDTTPFLAVDDPVITVEKVLGMEPDRRADDVTGYEMPTVAHLNYRSTFVMVVRARLDDGGHRLELFTSMDGVAWERFPWGELDAISRRDADSEGVAHDALEVASPSLVVHNGAYHLYYAGRRGTRWSIGLLASDGLIYWRRVGGDDAVFGRAGAGFERAGVLDPDVHSRDSDVAMVYVGTDGAHRGIGRASRLATNDAGGGR